MAGTLLKTLKFLKIAVDKLGLKFSLVDIERIGIMVDKAMSTEARSFHTAEHIFALADTDRPILLMAAIFHDIVYYTVDLGFIPEIETIMNNYIDIHDHKITIKKDISAVDPMLEDIFDLFAFHPGDELPPFGGMNEFLSTLVMYHEFKNHADRILMLAISCCIELTIPFRGTNKEGLTPPERLAIRLEKINSDKQLKLSGDAMLRMIQDAAIFANTDVLNFSSNEVGIFLDNTWKLLPETNPALRTSGIYTVKNYRIALEKIHGFMQFLDPKVIFLSYKGAPNEFDFHYLNFRANRNVLAAREYLGVKLLSIGILEAITQISGGDTPVALLMGDTSDLPSLQKFEEMLPALDANQGPTITPTVFALLDQGRQNETSFDLNRSPLSRFVYLFLGTEKLADYLKALSDMFKDTITATDFLNMLPAKLILPIVRACAAMSFTRRNELQTYFKNRIKKK